MLAYDRPGDYSDVRSASYTTYGHKIDPKSSHVVGRHRVLLVASCAACNAADRMPPPPASGDLNSDAEISAWRP